MIPPPTREDFAVNVQHAYNCSPLLPDPGGEVVRTFIRLLEDARRERKEIADSFVRMEKYANDRDAELRELRGRPA